MAITTTLTVIYVGEQASVFITMPAGASIGGEHVVRYEVEGPRPIVAAGVHQIGDFRDWRRMREAEGFKFSNPQVVGQ
jgi:hypothetical protein